MPQSKSVGYGKKFIYYTNMQLRHIYEVIKIPPTFAETFKTKTYSKEIMESVFRADKISELCISSSPHERRNRKKSFDPSGELMMKKTTILTGNHLKFRERAGSSEESYSHMQNTIAEKVAEE